MDANDAKQARVQGVGVQRARKRAATRGCPGCAGGALVRIAASPLLLLVAAIMLLGWLLLGDQGLLHYWQSLLQVGGVTGALVGGWLAERVRLRHGLLAFYARLMNNPELNR